MHGIKQLRCSIFPSFFAFSRRGQLLLQLGYFLCRRPGRADPGGDDERPTLAKQPAQRRGQEAQGEDAQGISLGVFSSDDAAQSHLVFLAERGYEAEIKQIPRLSRGYWIHRNEESLSNLDLEPLIEEFPQVSLSETACIN